MNGKMYTIYRIEKAINESNINIALKMTYKSGRGHFNIFLSRIEKVSDFKKVMDILADSDNLGNCADIVRNYIKFVFGTTVSLRKEKEGYSDDESKSVVMYCDTLIKRYNSFADAFNKIMFDQKKIISLENAPEVPKAKKDSYYIMQFDKIAHKWVLHNVFGFSFIYNGFYVGIHKTPDGKTWDAALLGYGATFGMTAKSKKAAIYAAIDTLKKCNFLPCKMEDTAARFIALAAENDIDISEQIKVPETTPTAAEDPETPETTPTAAEDPETPIVLRYNVCSFTPLSPGERHAAAIHTENAAPPMVVIWLYFAILQKHLFNVSHTLERCHVPVYGFTRLLYSVVTLLLYYADFSGLLSGLPLFMVSNFSRARVPVNPCIIPGFTALRVPEYVKTVCGLTRVKNCRTPYHDTS